VDKLTLAQVCRTAEHAKSSPQEMHCAMWTHGQVAQMAQALLDSQQAISGALDVAHDPIVEQILEAALLPEGLGRR